MLRFLAGDERESLPPWLRRGLDERLGRDVELPVPSETALRVMAACQDERGDLSELAELVRHDQALAAHVLRVANSVVYAPQGTVRSLRQALARLGLATVGDIALAVTLKQRVFVAPGHEARLRTAWLHSVASACYAQDLATLLGRDREAAFLSGLLHDVGVPMVLKIVCDLVAQHPGEPPLAPATLDAALDAYHTDLGVRLAERWRFGPRVVAAIRHHHSPADAPGVDSDVAIITLADHLAEWAADGSRTEEEFTAEAELLPDVGVPQEAFAGLLGARSRILDLSTAYQ